VTTAAAPSTAHVEIGESFRVAGPLRGGGGRRVLAAGRSYAADSFFTSQPGKTRTAGWTVSARAMTLARSRPRLILSFSIAEIVDWGIPVSPARSVWLSS